MRVNLLKCETSEFGTSRAVIEFVAENDQDIEILQKLYDTKLLDEAWSEIGGRACKGQVHLKGLDLETLLPPDLI